MRCWRHRNSPSKKIRLQSHRHYLSPLQAEKASENAKTHNVSHLCTFKVMDYMNTELSSEYFDLIIGIESICYAEPKISFLKEAHRLLKKNGKLVLAENLQGKEKLNKKRICFSLFKCISWLPSSIS